MARTTTATKVLDAQSLDASFTLPAAGIPIGVLKSFAIRLIWTGTPTGDFVLQISSDGQNWCDRGSIKSAAGSAGSCIFEETTNAFLFARIDWSRSAGSGAVTALLTGVE